MTSYRYAVAIAALALVSCSDEKADKDLLAPEAAVEAVGALSPDFSAMAGNGSSVCVASQKDLAAVEAQLQQASTAELLETKEALTAITADVCN
jgi:hypothetical protein